MNAGKITGIDIKTKLRYPVLLRKLKLKASTQPFFSLPQSS